jgi:hypothetical protein
MTNGHPHHTQTARKFGFVPWAELNSMQQNSIVEYCLKYYKDDSMVDSLWWKESTQGDGNWISYDVTPYNRINAPHLNPVHDT